MSNTTDESRPFVRMYSEPWEKMSLGQRHITFLDFIITRRDFGYLCILFHKFIEKVSQYDDRKNKYAEYKKIQGKNRPIYSKEGFYESLRREINRAEFEFLLGWSQALRGKDEISIIGEKQHVID